MKLLTLATLFSAAIAAPSDLQKRQECGPSFVFARGTGEAMGLGNFVGAPLERSLKKYFPNLKSYPVMYAASVPPNLSAARTDEAAMSKGVEAFEKAYSACPAGAIVAGGYSQGAAVMHNVIGAKLSKKIKDRIAGVALFGDTRNKQDNGMIPNFPKERAKVWCNQGDGVCGGQLNVNQAHMSYATTQPAEAAKYLSDLVKAMT